MELETLPQSKRKLIKTLDDLERLQEGDVVSMENEGFGQMLYEGKTDNQRVFITWEIKNRVKLVSRASFVVYDEPPIKSNTILQISCDEGLVQPNPDGELRILRASFSYYRFKEKPLQYIKRFIKLKKTNL